MGPEEKNRDETASRGDVEALSGRLIEGILEQIERGESIDLEEACARHPDFADALRQLLPQLLALSPAIESTNAPRAPAPGSTLGDFRLVREIRGGGMGVVFEADQISLRRRVAVKILPWTLGLSAAGRRRFLREAEALAKLNHPAIVSVLAVGESGGVHYLAMELVEGVPLDQVIRSWREEATGAAGGPANPPIRAELVAKLGAALARALDVVHDKELLHRDVKPSNVILRGDGTPKLIDFGLAREGQDLLTATGQTPGTPAYMSPEQISGLRDLDRRSDVYALGATLYEMLTLRRPFEGETSGAFRQGIAVREPRRPRTIDAKIPRDLETIVLRCLEPHREHRYASAAALAADLERFLRFEPIEAKPPGPAARTWKFLRRHPIESATVAAAILCLAALLVYQAIARRIEERKRVDEELLKVRESLARFDEKNSEIVREKPRLAEATWLLEREFQPAEKRQEILEARRRLAASERESDQAFQDAIFGIQNLLSLEPGNSEAFTLASDLHFSRWRRAVEERDEERAETIAREVMRYDRAGRHREAMERLATVTFRVSPEGAACFLYRYRPERETVAGGSDRLVAVAVGGADASAGTAPLAPRRLPRGSYLAIFRKEGFEDLRLPFALERGDDQVLTTELLPAKSSPDGFVYIPGGPVWVGGDALAFGPRPRRRADVPPFWIARFEITVGEYMEFVNDPETIARINEARANGSPILLPRDPADPTAKRIKQREDGTFQVGWNPRWPILAISFEDAATFAAWRTEKAGALGEPFEYDLPEPDQWEKAARGADERIYPWGNVFDWSYSKGHYSAAVFAPEPVDTYPHDESPYGVRNMAGCIREWNKGWVSKIERSRPLRGGGWSSPFIAHFRAATWFAIDAQFFDTGYGFRLVARRRP